MISSWLTSWYQQNEQQQQQEPQLQEPFNDEYETTDDWVEVITPSMKQIPEKNAPIKTWPEQTVDEVQNIVVQENKVISEYQVVEEAPVKENKTAAVSKEVVEEDIFEGKKLSRQERRAKARFAAREIKKQARNAAMVINRNRGKGLAVSACLPAAPLATN